MLNWLGRRRVAGKADLIRHSCCRHVAITVSPAPSGDEGPHVLSDKGEPQKRGRGDDGPVKALLLLLAWF